MSSPQQPNAQQNPGNAVLEFYDQWSQRTPAVTRYTCFSLLAIYITSFFIHADMVLGDMPYYTVMHFEIYRLLLSPLVGNSFLNVLILLYMFPTIAGRMENSLGSLSFLTLMGVITLFVNLFFNVVCLILYWGGSEPALFYNCCGFWTIVMALITMDCMFTPDVPRNLIIVSIPGKYYPLVIYAIFSLLGGGNLLSHAISVFFGYAYSLGYLDRLKTSSAYLATLETPNGFFFSASRAQGWVLAGSALGHEAWTSAPVADRASNTTSSSSANRGRWGSVASMDDTEAPANSGSASAPAKQNNMFPGSGHKLTPTTSGLNYSLKSMLAEDSKPSKEDVATKRLAALGQSSQSVMATAPGLAIVDRENAIANLQEMGFSFEDSSRALSLSDGTLAGALQLLTT